MTPAVMLGCVKARERLKEQAGTTPCDCVRQYPTLNPAVVDLVAFDATGTPRLRIELSADEDLELWEAWMLRWVRRRYPTARELRLIG